MKKLTLGRVEDTHGLFIAHKTSLGLAVLGECTLFTEIVPTSAAGVDHSGEIKDIKAGIIKVHET